jgi:hypothetical protein
MITAAPLALLALLVLAYLNHAAGRAPLREA